MKPSVAVIGGGWAGCAAALTLAEAGVAVTLFEASRTLGGRARGVEIDGRKLDNGQHLLLGAYASCLDLIARATPGDATAWLWRRPLRVDQPPAFRLACPPLPAPLHLLAGFAAARGLAWRDKWAAARWARHLLTGPDMADDTSVATLTRDQPEAVNRLLWHPLCVSALNTPPALASARVFVSVVRAAFGGRRADSDFLLPKCDLGTLFPMPAAARIAALGGRVRTSCRVRSIETASDAITLRIADEALRFTHAIVAVAPQHLAALAEYVRELDAARRMLASYRYLPIATAYVQVDPAFRLSQPLIALCDGPAQFVFDRGQSHGQPGMLAFVASAARDLPADWLDRAEAQLRRFATPGPTHWRRAIVDKQATYACTPGLSRPSVRTPHPRLFLAGDYTAGPFPATLESATSSGVQSAHALLDRL
ncbi:MAG: hydroxysqualene dehydroxylase HpnE [Thiobacillus sp.]|nr:hydroxysqualene dehydroxylase HpnE [Thiobacillus sp.]